MSGNLEILINNNCYKTDKYPISYRLVILHSLYKFIQNKIINKEEKNKIKKEFNEIIEQAKNYIDLISENENKDKLSLKEYFEQGYTSTPECFSFYLFYDHTRKFGLISVDHMDGCYPLIFYDDKCNDVEKVDRKGFRLDGLKTCMSKINQKKERLFEVLYDADGWNEKIKKSILEIIPEPS